MGRRFVGPEALAEEDEPIPVRCQATADLINDAHREFAGMAPSMLKRKVVALVFLPWLTRYTARLMRAAKDEERRAILADLSRAGTTDGGDEWSMGYRAAVERLHALILARAD